MILKIWLTKSAKILMTTKDKYFLTLIKTIFLKDRTKKIETASKDNGTIKNMKDDLLNITCWNMHGLKEDKAEMIKGSLFRIWKTLSSK